MIQLKKPLILKALTFFIENPYKEIYLREFSRNLKISLNSAQRFLNIFLKEELITEKRKANLRYFKANINNILFRYIKKAYSIKKLKDSGLIDSLKEFNSVILFGSTAKGLDDENSDIDLVCIGGNKKFPKEELYDKVNREINIHIFNLAEWKKQAKQNKAFYQDVIIDGINLIGEIPIIN